ncbi:MAG TPA: hypothetical protein PK665_15205, partial [Ignavibacteriaceae bacterium]|nr:hypothetical protein [Ignavibacteriaceae bacterium]
MKKCLLSLQTFLFIISIILLNSYSSHAQEAISLGGKQVMVAEYPDAECTGPGSIIYDDGTFENGYSWNASTVSLGRFVQLVTPQTYPWNAFTFCIALTRLATSPANLTFNIVVYATDGTGGAPGTLIHTISGVTASSIPVYPSFGWYDYDVSTIPQLSSGAYFIGYEFVPTSPSIYLGADESTTTPRQTCYGFTNGSGWFPLETSYANYRALGLRTIGTIPSGPGQAANPNPVNGSIDVSAPNVTLSWTNSGDATTNSVYFGNSPSSLTQIHTGSLISSIGRTGLEYNKTYYWRVDEINNAGTTVGPIWNFTTMANPFMPPSNLQSSVVGQNVNLSWNIPVLRWDNGINYNSIGLVSGGTFEVSARFPASVTGNLAGKTLEAVEFYINDMPTSCIIKIYDQGTPTSPGTLLRSMDVTSQIVDNDWNYINLATPYTLTSNDIWIGYEVTHDSGAHVCGVDPGPALPNGDWIKTSGGWAKLSVMVPTLNYNWNIAGVLSPLASGDKPIVINSSAITEDEFLFSENGSSQIKNKDMSNMFSSLSDNKKFVTGIEKKDKFIFQNKSKYTQYFGFRSGEQLPTGYNVYRDGSQIASNVAGLSYSDLSVPLGLHEYKVTAQYSGGESKPAVITAVVGTISTINVYPQSAQFWTGNTEGTVKTDGEINTVYPKYGWAVFDISSIPAGAIITSAEFNGYVNASSHPWWAIATMGNVNPVTADASTIFDQIDLWEVYGYYQESGTIPLGWISRPFNIGSPVSDIQNALTQGWFALGFLDTDESPSWYINFDGWSQANPPYLKIEYVTGSASTFPLSVNITDGWNMVSVP